jgi:hypothetical protein
MRSRLHSTTASFLHALVSKLPILNVTSRKASGEQQLRIVRVCQESFLSFSANYHKACPQKRGPKNRSPSDDGRKISKHRKITVSQCMREMAFHCKTNLMSGQESVKEGICRSSKT